MFPVEYFYFFLNPLHSHFNYEHWLHEALGKFAKRKNNFPHRHFPYNNACKWNKKSYLINEPRQPERAAYGTAVFGASNGNQTELFLRLNCSMNRITRIRHVV